MSENLKKIEERIVERLKRAGRVLIAAHVNPDGDSIGSQLAMAYLCRQLGSSPAIINHDPALPKYAFLSGADDIIEYASAEIEEKFDLAVLLEAPELTRIGDVEKLLTPDCEIINIDHHHDNGKYGAIDYVDESVSAVGIQVYRLFGAARVKVTSAVAEAIFTCILTDTGRFRFSSTNAEAMRVCGEMLELGADPKKISDALYASYSESQLRMLGELLAGMEINHDGESCLLIQDGELRERYSDGQPEIESLSDYTIYTRGVKIGALLRELEKDRTKISLRCHDPFDVSKIAKRYGGGGHRNAAGCIVSKPLADAKDEIKALIGEALNRESDERDERVSAG